MKIGSGTKTQEEIHKRAFALSGSLTPRPEWKRGERRKKFGRREGVRERETLKRTFALSGSLTPRPEWERGERRNRLEGGKGGKSLEGGKGGKVWKGKNEEKV